MSAKKQPEPRRDFKPRTFMERAIEVMRQSVIEPRSDGKVPPKVGAVLVDIGAQAPPHDRVSTACRGELREGDHAEYTLLERKNRDRKLDSCVLFATLEPCAPKSRNPPKLGCAERIVAARIKEVWIGIEDPDPTVDRKGIEYLQEQGVTVHMFDRDLQDIIRGENKEFLEQALERADAEEVKSREVVLSSLEAPFASAQFSEFSVEALKEFRTRARIAEDIDTPEFKRRLIQQGLVQFENDQFVPTGFGMLLFGKEPRLVMPQAGLLATVHSADGREATHDFVGPQVLVPDQVIRWLSRRLHGFIDRRHARRRNSFDVLSELCREGVVNALVHRNYDIVEAKCQLNVYPNRIEIWSPGLPVRPITIEQMSSLEAPMLSRNPVLHYVFAQMELAEERGLGLKSMRLRSEEAGLPLPRFTWNEPYLILTLFLSRDAALTTLPADVLGSLSDSEKEGWQWLSTKLRTKSQEYADALRVEPRTARRHLTRFAELGLVRISGSGPATEYVVE